jgi:iron complex outermembrane receptor protein
VIGVNNELYLGQNTNNRKYTQEVRLSSNEGAKFDWMVGGYFTDEKGLIHQEYIAVAPGTLTPADRPAAAGRLDLTSRYKEYAGFANATVHLSDRLDIDMGGRYSHNKQDARPDHRRRAGRRLADRQQRQFVGQCLHLLGGAQVKFDDRRSLYARVAKGYRPGGPNVIPPSAPAGTPATFAPDKVTSYEAGFKG